MTQMSACHLVHVMGLDSPDHDPDRKDTLNVYYLFLWVSNKPVVVEM